MKHVVVSSDFREAEIRPPKLLSEFKRLSVADAKKYFGDPAALVEVANPATGAGIGEFVFEKDGFRYCQSPECGSVYVSPRPTRETLIEYYRTSEASRYQVQHYARETQEARRRHLLRNHASWMRRVYDETGTNESRVYVDVGTNNAVIFDEVKSLDLFDEFYSLNPLPGLEEECEQRGVKIVDAPIEGAAAVTAFQQLESRFSPIEYFEMIKGMLVPQGLLFFTTRTISGFDLQTLWDKTPYIFVPEHLNLLSIRGLELLIDRVGMEVVELSTPGQLDIELVEQASKHDPTLILPRFIDYLIKERGDRAHQEFQAFLQKHRLSSHVRVASIRN